MRTLIAELALEAICNPEAALELAKKYVCNRRNHVDDPIVTDLTEEEKGLLRGILQPWWDTEKQASPMLLYTTHLSGRDGKRSLSHRKAVLLSILCARTVVGLSTESKALEKRLGEIEDWICGFEEEPVSSLERIGDLWDKARPFREDGGYTAEFYACSAAYQAGYVAFWEFWLPPEVITEAWYAYRIGKEGASQEAFEVELADMFRYFHPEVPM